MPDRLPDPAALVPPLDDAFRLLLSRSPPPRPSALRRMWRGVRSHFPQRATEWFAACFLLQFGAILYFPPSTFATSASWRVMGEWASEQTWGAACIVVATAHLAALLVNGTFKGFRFSPHIRAIAGFLAIAMWLHIAVAFALSALPGSPGPGTHRAMLVLGLYNFIRAVRDTGTVDGRRARHAR